ncbi:MAG TPA: HAD hydrolase-like protein [Capsulimonadaceae bacterium]|jgi:pyrophosphatase PpaX
MSRHEYKAILWDVDGTLIDTTALIVGVLGNMFHHFTGEEVPHEELRGLIGIPLAEQVAYLGSPDKFGTTTEEMVAYAVRGYERGRDLERVIPEAIAALIELKRRGMLTALVTSKNDVELANTLPRLGISAYCDVIVGADQVAPNFKPHPRPVLLALDKLGITHRDSALFIGDSAHDMQSGHAAGVHIAAVTWGAATEEMLLRETPELIFTKPADIVPTLIADADEADTPVPSLV